MGKNKDKETSEDNEVIHDRPEPSVPQQPVNGGVDGSFNIDAQGEEELLSMQIKSPHIVAMTLTTIMSNGQGETMYAVARDERGLQIQIDNFIRAGH